MNEGTEGNEGTREKERDAEGPVGTREPEDDKTGFRSVNKSELSALLLSSAAYYKIIRDRPFIFRTNERRKQPSRAISSSATLLNEPIQAVPDMRLVLGLRVQRRRYRWR